jgi:RNA polymerase sigma factor (TIGR02999 family)
MARQKQATELLVALRNGNRAALDDLLPLVYEELRAIARRKLRGERRGHTLVTTALVHEAYLKLVRLERIPWQSRAHFLAIAGHAMRNILVDYARRRASIKHGGAALQVSLAEAEEVPAADAERILALDDALRRLAAENSRHARIVECRVFGGMSIEETACALDVSKVTVNRDWRLLKAWLRLELDPDA